MSYSIHIERVDASGRLIPIEPHEMVNAVDGIEGLRLAPGTASTTNPNTGELINARGSAGDVEIYMPARDEWIRTFILSLRGRITFRAPADFGDAGSATRSFARALAQKLQAIIVGDEGESYT